MRSLLAVASGTGLPRSAPHPAGRVMAHLLAAGLILFGGAMSAAPALAHEGDSSTEGYLLVQQALAHLVHDPADVMPALEKIDDVLNAPDQEGVSVPEVRQAQAALLSGDVARGRSLLQHSITVALSTVKPAAGEGTGTTEVLDPLPPRTGLTGTDWVLLTVSVLAVAGGLLLAYAFRPRENVRALRLLLASRHRRPDLPAKHDRSGPRDR